MNNLKSQVQVKIANPNLKTDGRHGGSWKILNQTSYQDLKNGRNAVI